MKSYLENEILGWKHKYQNCEENESPDPETEEMTYVSPVAKETTEKSYLPEVLAGVVVLLLAIITAQYNQNKKLKAQVSNPKVGEIEESLMNKA